MIPFIAAKALSFLPFGNLLRGTSGKLILIGVAVAALAFLVWKWKDNIREEAYNQIFSQQAEQLISEQRKEFERLQEVIKQSSKIERETLEKRQALIVEIETLRNRIRSATAEEDGPVAPVLQDAIEFIRRSEAKKAGRPENAVEKAARIAGEAVEKVEGSGNAVVDAWKKGLKKNE